ncbi:MAG: hypothetical protein EAZ43_13250 [Betaproteobacteria bacterium]|nr:MAG: hypothetical protein EAZ43_13250 [Betaproteobacteria bacterium]
MSDTSEDMKDDYSAEFAAAIANGTAVRGLYYERVMRAKRLVEIDEDLLPLFANAAELNAALRGAVEIARHVKAKAA